jgi:hypothetical protein
MAEYRNDFANKLSILELFQSFKNLLFETPFFLDSFKKIFTIYVERSIGIINNYLLSIQYDFFDLKFLKIYEGFFSVFIPTELYVNKPILGSPGLVHDMAMYRSMVNYNSEGMMGSVLASGHAFWELGYFGLILYPFFYVVLLKILTSARLPYFPFLNILISLIILGGLITDSFSTLFIPIYAIIDIFLKSCIPLIIILYFLKYFFKSNHKQV